MSPRVWGPDPLQRSRESHLASQQLLGDKAGILEGLPDFKPTLFPPIVELIEINTD